ncbi:MAG: PAS domain-containing protein, partial [Desulfobacterales bacterium]|nr:PAS domain-containing protein [Desulfobacterales bacterium]
MNVVNHEDDLFVEEAPAAERGESGEWKVLVVDDEEDVHGMTDLVLRNFSFEGKPLSILHAYSAREGLERLSEHPDVAVIFLDVVMETETAGLDMVKTVRDELNNRLPRIVLRTGHPGKAPGREILENYEIDDYKIKTDLTADVLRITAASSLRAYKNAAAQEARAEALERKVTERTEALEKSEEMRRELVNRINSGVAVYEAREEGRDFVFKDFNRAGERIEKVKKEDLIGKSVLEVFPGVEELGLLDALRKVWLTGEPRRHPVSVYEDDRVVGWRDNYIYKLPSGEVVAVYTDETEKKRGEEKQRQYLSFLENMNRINQVLHRETDFERMMGHVLDSVLSIFRCDRAWLLFPCDPGAASWRVPMERARPEHPGAGASGGGENPMTPELVRRLQTLLNSEAPVSGYPRADDDSPRTPGIEYDVRASLAMAIYPIKGKPWAFGLHQCDGDRKWTEAERELFKEIGHRISEV